MWPKMRHSDSWARLASPLQKLLTSAEDQWQSILRVADHDHFCVRTLGEVLRCFDSFPLQELCADALRYCGLEVAYALRFDAFAFCFLTFFLQLEAHSQRFLLGLLLRLN